jgi:putative ABC transport system substrate-binding protein
MVNRSLAAWVGFVALPMARSQTAKPVGPFRIGWLSGGSSDSYAQFIKPFRESLGEQGWIEGRHYVLLPRFAEGRLSDLDELARGLAHSRADVVVATTPSALRAAQKATKTIPIVMMYGPDPAEAGVVASLARPGGNVTGLTSLSVDLSVKQLELLHALVPGVTRVAVLWNPANPWHPSALRRLRAAAPAMGLQVIAVRVRGPEELDAAFATMVDERAGALLSLSDPMTFVQRARLAELAIRHGLASMHGVTAYCEAGGLASYWPNDAAMQRRVATYVARILGQGTKPADLPVEQPTQFELVINLKTARRLGIVVPASFLARADRTID